MSGLVVARVETALSLSFHIMFAVFGVGLPWLLLYAERRWVKGPATPADGKVRIATGRRRP